VRRARQDGDEDQQFAASANWDAIRHWLGDSIEPQLGTRRRSSIQGPSSHRYVEACNVVCPTRCGQHAARLSPTILVDPSLISMTPLP
jgi:hypothetical protein